MCHFYAQKFANRHGNHGYTEEKEEKTKLVLNLRGL